MKKILLGLSALLMVTSGVAAVSAYEAHVVNVKATVENALQVPTPELNYGTVFPEEWLTKEFKIKHSSSFCDFTQGGRLGEGMNVDAIDYEIWVIRKPVPQNPRPEPYPNPVENINGTDYYYWLGDALYLGIFDIEPVDPDKKYPLGAPGAPQGELVPVTTSAAPILSDTITKLAYGAPDDWYDVVVVGLDVPVFVDYWNRLTDVPVKPSGFNGPTVVLSGDRNVQGIVLGADIVIQVTDIYLWP